MGITQRHTRRHEYLDGKEKTTWVGDKRETETERQRDRK